MPVRYVRSSLALVIAAFAFLAAEAARACDLDSECGEGQACIDYVCKKAPSSGSSSSNNSSASSSSSSSSSSGSSAGAAAGDVKAKVKDGTVGISVQWPGGGQGTIGLAYFTGPNGSLRLNVGVAWQINGNSGFGWSLEPSYRVYFGGTRLKPFIEPGVYLAYTQAQFDLALTIGLGAEFFIWNQLSLGAVAGLGLKFADLADSGRSYSLTTGTSSLFLAYYW